LIKKAIKSVVVKFFLFKLTKFRELILWIFQLKLELTKNTARNISAECLYEWFYGKKNISFAIDLISFSIFHNFYLFYMSEIFSVIKLTIEKSHPNIVISIFYTLQVLSANKSGGFKNLYICSSKIILNALYFYVYI